MQGCTPEWRTKFIPKGGNYKRIKNGSKRKHGDSGPENFVHPPFKISGSAPEPFREKNNNLKLACHKIYQKRYNLLIFSFKIFNFCCNPLDVDQTLSVY